MNLLSRVISSTACNLRRMRNYIPFLAPNILPTLLMHMDGADDGTTFVDSANGHVFSRTGTVHATSIDQAKFGSASMYSDGTDDSYVISTETTITNFGTRDFTIDFWVYPLSWNNIPQGGNGITLVGCNNTPCITQYGSENRIGVYLFNSWAILPPDNTAPAINTWSHIALVRHNTTMTLYINGASIGSTISTFDWALGSISVGGSAGAGGGYESFNGYIDEVRVFNGLALYTEAFTPPSIAAPDHGVVLGMHMDGADGSTTFTDVTGKVITAVAPVQISTTQKKFGGSSAYFDGTTSALSVVGRGLDFRTSDFTVEMWVMLESMVPAFMHLIDTRPSDDLGYAFGIKSNGQLFLYSNNAMRIEGGTITTGEWYHVALCRSSGTTKIFLDGNQVGSDWVGLIDYTQYGMWIGKYYLGAAYPLHGYIDDLLITKGVALYTENFTRPSAPFTV